MCLALNYHSVAKAKQQRVFNAFLPVNERSNQDEQDLSGRCNDPSNSYSAGNSSNLKAGSCFPAKVRPILSSPHASRPANLAQDLQALVQETGTQQLRRNQTNW